jgi:chlorite dismutase
MEAVMNKEKDAPRRQFVSFSFHRLLPEWRRLPLGEREEHRRELAETIRKWCLPDNMRVLTYSMVGMRGDVDIMLWRICYSLSCLQEMASDVLRTRIGGYLETPYSYLSMTRRSEYLINEQEENSHSMLRSMVRPGGSRFLFVYPLVRTRNWYLLPFEDRQRAVQELLKLYRDFPQTHVHVTYSFGLDSQDFVIAIETDHPDRLVERTMRIRETESSIYIQSDTPVFSCVQASVEDMLERIG